MKFRKNGSITKDNRKEEFFHAWQDAFYPGGISQYLNVGKVNIEFEAKVFKDIIMEAGSYSAFFAQETDEEKKAYREYAKWIENVKGNTSILLNSQEYNKWLDLFNALNPLYSSPKNSNFSAFNSLYNLIKMSNCF